MFQENAKGVVGGKKMESKDQKIRDVLGEGTRKSNHRIRASKMNGGTGKRERTPTTTKKIHSTQAASLATRKTKEATQSTEKNL